jgi:hypothetical protein
MAVNTEATMTAPVGEYGYRIIVPPPLGAPRPFDGLRFIAVG